MNRKLSKVVKKRKIKSPTNLNAEIEKKDFFALLKKAVSRKAS